MIKIAGRSRRRVSSTLRELPVGSVRLADAELGFAQYERVEATSGCFSSAYAQFTAVLTRMPSTGPVRFNGGDMAMLQERTRALCFFRPDDRVEGVWRTHNSYEMLLFKPGHVERFLDEELNGRAARVEPLLRVEPTQTIVWLFRQLVALQGLSNDTAQMQLELVSNMLIAQIAGIDSFKSAPNVLDLAHDVSNVMRHIHDNLGTTLTIAQLARIAGLSRFHFCRVFKRATGCTVHQYVVEHRLARARAMLESTNQPISQIALDAGFASQSHLNASFKAQYGLTPGAWRKQQKS